ncbi:MAG: VOC family protein [Myxococcales bacterium]|nr:VOC family protein [Myxococcales bacterium]USN51987.1 MAG: VOC family protein [Myxococcales bacterium]
MATNSNPPIRANLQLIFVSDIKKSTSYYTMLFETEPVFTSPRYVAFSAGDEKVLFALWTGKQAPDPQAPRFHEIGIMVSSNDEVEKLFQKWRKNSAINIIQEPVSEVFGLTFLVKDPDGHIIRVSPLD